MISSINQRISLIVQHFSLSVNAFAKSVGISQPSMKAIIDGDNAPSFKMIDGMLIAYPMISAEWLLRGIDPMIKQESQESADMPLLDYYKALVQDLHAQLDEANARLSAYEKENRAKLA